jgi:hypothetical protein
MGRIRSIHPDACQSETLAKLTASQERTFFRLLTYCDDDGRAPANPRLIKAAIYPLHDEMGPKQVQAELVALQAAGVLIRYTVEGKEYLQVTSWTEYQHPKNPSASKIPPLPQGLPLPTPGLPQDFPESGESLPPALPIPSLNQPLGVGEGVGEGEGEGGGKAFPEPDLPQVLSGATSSGAPPPRGEVVFFPTVGKGAGLLAITVEQAQEWAKDFPAVDVLQALRSMRAWLMANPTKRKTARGIPAFVVRWLAKEQNNPKSRAAPPGRPGSQHRTFEADEAFAAQLGDIEIPDLSEVVARVG